MDASAVQTIWTLSLVIFAVVLAVVAALLTLIVREAKRVRAAVEDIWTVGQQIANNTIHIPLLHRTNHLVGRIFDSAGGVVAATTAVREHAQECPGCPRCVLGPGWSR